MLAFFMYAARSNLSRMRADRLAIVCQPNGRFWIDNSGMDLVARSSLFRYSVVIAGGQAAWPIPIDNFFKEGRFWVSYRSETDYAVCSMFAVSE